MIEALVHGLLLFLLEHVHVSIISEERQSPAHHRNPELRVGDTSTMQVIGRQADGI
jgi:hypothetical protein